MKRFFGFLFVFVLMLAFTGCEKPYDPPSLEVGEYIVTPASAFEVPNGSVTILSWLDVQPETIEWFMGNEFAGYGNTCTDVYGEVTMVANHFKTGMYTKKFNVPMPTLVETLMGQWYAKVDRDDGTYYENLWTFWGDMTFDYYGRDQSGTVMRKQGTYLNPNGHKIVLKVNGATAGQYYVSWHDRNTMYMDDINTMKVIVYARYTK